MAFSAGCPGARLRAAACLVTLAAAALISGRGNADQDVAAEGDVIVFGGDASYPPFEWYEDRVATGFNIDLQDAVAAAAGRRAEHRLGNWPDIVSSLQSGAVDAVAMFRSPARESRFLFTRAFDVEHHSIFASPGASKVTSVEELEGLRVVVEGRSYAHDRIVAADLSMDLVLESNTLAALQSLAAGHADYAILAATAATSLIESRNLALRATGPPFWPTEYALAVRMDQPGLAALLDEGLRRVFESGEFQAIKSRWDGHFAPPERSTNTTLLYAVASVLAGVVILAAWRVVHLHRGLRSARSRLAWADKHVSDTGLPKARHFAEIAQRILTTADSPEQKQIVALRLAGYDRTVQTRGDAAGREQVQRFAERLKAAGFQCCGQLGRKTFVVFGDRRSIARELRPLHDHSETVAMKVPYPRIIAGSAAYPQHGRTISDLLRRAECALAHALKSGDGWSDFRPFMEPQEHDETLVTLFRARGGDVIRAVFQPQIDLKTGQVIGAEALARWDAPDIGSVSPARFVPLLEDAGLTRHLTRRMISEAMRVSAMTRDRGRVVPISVNITGTDLMGWKLSRHIFRAIDDYSGSPADLKLELTETSVIKKPEILQWKMKRLTRKGVEISIDDFGTGYATFAYLSTFPVSEVKIDQTFIQGMQQRGKDLQIVKSTISMGHELGLVVVAEGVETEETLNMLRQLGCDRAQGYAISRPLEIADFLAFVEKRAAPVVKAHRGKVTAFRRPEA